MAYLTSAGHDVHVTCTDTADKSVADLCRHEGATFHEVLATRNPSPMNDARSLLAVGRIVETVQPDIIVAGTPKMSLLLLFAGTILRVERRVYLCHGLRHEGLSGIQRLAGVMLERLLCWLSTGIVAVSRSVADGLSQIGVQSNSIVVLGAGSPNGVDIERFRQPSASERTAARANLGLNSSTRQVVLFIGRLTHDKGISAILQATRELPDSLFVMAGPQEPRDDEDRRLLAELERTPTVTMLGKVSEVEGLYHAADVLALPTRREGLPTVVIEAAASGTPCVAMRATGTVDAIRNHETGILVPQGDVHSFVQALRSVTPDRHRHMSQSARRFAVESFASQHVWSNWQTYIEEST